MKPASVEIQSVVKFHCTMIIACYWQLATRCSRSDVSWGSEVKLIAHAPQRRYDKLPPTRHAARRLIACLTYHVYCMSHVTPYAYVN